MGWQAWVTLAVVAGTVVVLARDLLPPAMAVLGATISLLVVGVLTPEQAFAGFSNPAPITVAALYVMARAVEVTGALDPVIGAVLRGNEASPGQRPSHARTSVRLARLTGPTAAASAFLNNTPIVAMLAPQVSDWAQRRGFSASPLLMPLSFAAILGGLCTAIGTSTNLVISGLLEEAGEPPLGLFEISRVGVPLAVLGLVVVIVLASRVLPDRHSSLADFADSVREFTMAMRVIPGGPLDGVTVDEGGLRHLQGVYLVRIDRDGRTIAPVAPEEWLAGGDVLTFAGKVDLVVDLHRHRGLASTEEHHVGSVKDVRQRFFEVVLGHESLLVGRTLKGVEFRSRYGAAVLAIHRAGQRVDAKLGEVELRAGDTLLVLADQSFYPRWRESRDFLLVSPLGGNPPTRNRKAPLVALIVAGLLVVAGTGLMGILQAALVAAILLVAVGALTMREARDAVDLNVVILIAAAFGLGAAVSTTGLAEVFAGLLVDGFGPLGELGALLGVVVATIVLTELITNNAAAVLMFPIATATAGVVEASPRGYAIAVAVAASASFLTPIGYQTNTMVYGIGGYRFTDYPRLGLPLTFSVIAGILLIVPAAWPA